MIEDFSANEKKIAKSDGYYIHGEYVLDNFYYLSPFFRFEYWDRLSGQDNYDLSSQVYGVNCYLKGNQIRLGLMYQVDKFGSELLTRNTRGETFDDNRQVKITSMWHY